jgi:hypothetical protein
MSWGRVFIFLLGQKIQSAGHLKDVSTRMLLGNPFGEGIRERFHGIGDGSSLACSPHPRWRKGSKQPAMRQASQMSPEGSDRVGDYENIVATKALWRYPTPSASSLSMV